MKNVETFKGSDGIARTIDEWEDFVLERAMFSRGTSLLDVALESVHEATKSLFLALHAEGHPHDPEGDIESAAKAAGEYFALAIADAVKTKQSIESRSMKLIANTEKMAKCLDFNKFHKKRERSRLGLGIVEYIQEHKELPTSRKSLRRFIDERGKESHKLMPVLEEFYKAMPVSTPRDELEWYKLEDFCRDNQKG